MPPIDLLVGGVNFSDLQITIKEGIPAQLDAAGNVVSELIPAVIVNYGNFIQVVVDFLIIAFAIFMVIKAMNSAKKKEEAKPTAPPAPSKEEVLPTEIRDLLKNK